jgi:CRISPR-associated protein Cmr2
MTDWNQKIIAHLHDPPEKAYDYSSTHIERAEAHLRNLQVPESAWKGKEPDHVAAAADRFIFPATRHKQGDHWVATGVGNLGEGVQFKHPLTGKVALGNGGFPSEDEAHQIISQALPDFADKRDVDKFWLLWRLWLQFSVDHQHEKNVKAGTLAYLPADTRIPDGSIWHHMSTVSALEATRNADGHLRPAFLMFQIGPVQEFIAQARSTRDLWSGSYLLSWMMAHTLKSLAEKFGPDCVIFPSLRGQPLYDWLEQEKLKQAFHTTADGNVSANFWDVLRLNENQDLALTPNLPNRFLAIVPEGAAEFVRQSLATVFDASRADSEWSQICRKCWESLPAKDALPDNAIALWDFQIRNFWQVSWQLWPWEEVKPALDLFATIPVGKQSNLYLGWDVALAIPDKHKDTRCYTDDLKEIKSNGWAWSAHYQLLSHRLDARRQTRDFSAWQGTDKPGHKDHFSGKEEVIATNDWLKAARKADAFSHLFRHDDELGAVNLIKRVWHKVYLEKSRGFKREEFKFASVLGIAAAPWRDKVKERLLTDPDVCLVLRDFKRAVKDAEEILDFDLCREGEESRWLDRVDASVFQMPFWERLKPEAGREPLRDKAVSLLRELLTKARAGQPGKYFAVLALDGDQIGKWLSGEKTPEIHQVITESAARYFREHVKAPNVDAEKWLASNRPLSPSYHLQFSEALANFGLFCAARIVEAHHGQLIYSGGDDVLAMLPAEEVIACAQGLRLAFQGRSKELVSHAEGRYSHLFDSTAPDGFIRLKEGDWDRGCRRPAEPSWPLLVPGSFATVSVGICIGHIKEPLQDMIKEAQLAEQRAKTELDRNALAVTLFKRSGELIKWGAKFQPPKELVQNDEMNSAALRLLRFIQSNNRYRKPADQSAFEPPISGKFPYRLAELLNRYQDYEHRNGQRELSSPLPITSQVRSIAEKEVEWAVSRHCVKLPDDDRKGLLSLCAKCLEELEYLRRPLSDFIHLFALEAFIARQGE